MSPTTTGRSPVKMLFSAMLFWWRCTKRLAYSTNMNEGSTTASVVMADPRIEPPAAV